MFCRVTNIIYYKEDTRQVHCKKQEDAKAPPKSFFGLATEECEATLADAAHKAIAENHAPGGPCAARHTPSEGAVPS